MTDPDIKVPENLVSLLIERDAATSDATYMWGLGRVYGDTPERRVEWDIKCALAEKRKQKAWTAYETALNNHLNSDGVYDV